MDNNWITKLSLKKGLPVKIYWTDIAWALSIAAFSAVCFEMFYRMIVNFNDNYPSDMRYYAKKINIEDFKADRIVEKISQMLFSINKTTFEFNIYLVLIIVGIIIANFCIISYFIKLDGFSERVPRYSIQLASLIAMFVGPIYFPYLHEWYYRHSFEIMAWHNPTQQSMMLASMIALLCFYKMFLNYDKGVSIFWWVLTAATMLISTAIKPSFAMDMMVSVVILFLMELFLRKDLEFSVKFRRLFAMGCTLIPSGLYIIWLNTKEFGEETLNGGEFHVEFGLNTLRNNPDFIQMFFFGMTFTIVVSVVNHHRFRDSKYFLGLLLFITGFMQWALLSETGSRAKHGNFSWGRMFGSYFLVVICLTLLIENIFIEDSVFPNNKKLRKIYIAIALIVLVMSVLSQLKYFHLILTGNGYML